MNYKGAAITAAAAGLMASAAYFYSPKPELPAIGSPEVMKLVFGENPDAAVFEALADTENQAAVLLTMFLEWTAKYEKSYATKEVFADKYNIFVGNYLDLENHKTLSAEQGEST